MNAQSSETNQAIVDDEHPWPGLASFREQDECFFKGREPDIEELLSLVERERLTVLFGISGLGKSSLLQAGLFPRLRLNNVLPVYIRLDFSESSAPLTEQVFAAIAGQIQEKAIEASFHYENETLWAYFHRKDAEFWDARNRIVVPLLCFDQFEEIFTLGYGKRRTEINRFIIELADLTEGRCPESVRTYLDAHSEEAKNFNFSRHPYKLIFSLREDYLAHLEGLREWMPSVIHNHMRLLHMDGEQALAVADQTKGRLMESGIAETIVRVVAGKRGEDQQKLSTLCIEPALLSLVCHELNEHRIAQKVSQIDAQSVVSNREQILENFYERSLEDQTPELRHFIEDKLVTLLGYRNSEAYDNAVGIPGISPEGLDQLVQRRLLRLEERDGVKRIELIHDVLTGVVRKSRDQRLILEKQRRAEQERREAEQREQAARELSQAKRRTRVFGILTGFALLSSAWGLWGWSDAWKSSRKAEVSRKNAEASRKNAEESKRKVQIALADADFREAQRYYQDNNIPHALAYLAHAVRLDEDAVAVRTLLGNLLQQRSWFLPIGIFKHQADVSSAQFSPDGTKVVTASEDNTARLWDAKTGRSLGEAMTHRGPVVSAQFSLNGMKVVTASRDNTARLWDAKTGKSLGKVMAHKGVVWSAQFSRDGTKVVTASWDNTARLWDAKTGESLDEAMMHQGRIWSAQFSPDGTKVVTASEDKTARLWDATTGKPLGEAMMHEGAVWSAQFSPDGMQVVTASRDNTAQLWDVKTGKPLGEAMMHEGAVWSAQFSPDGMQVVTASWDNTARLWDAKTGKPLGEAMMHAGVVRTARFSPDGTKVVTTSEDNTARLWDAKTGKSLGEAMMHQGRVWSAQFNPEGVKVVTASEDKTARLWDAKTGKFLGEAMMHQESIMSARFSPDGVRVVTASADNTARVWDTKTGKPLSEPMMHQGPVWSAQFSPDGMEVVTASWDNTARLWDAKTGKSLGEAMTHQGPVWSVHFSPDGMKVVTASSDNTVRLWDAKTGKSVGRVMMHQDAVWSAQFSPDGNLLGTASWDNTARLWDAKTQETLRMAEHRGPVWSAQFSPDGTKGVTASEDKTVWLWDLKTGKFLGGAAHQDAVWSAQFSPDSMKVVTASKDKTARLWDAKTGKPLGEAMKHQGPVVSAQFNSESTKVVTASEDKTARLWDAKTGKPLSEPMKHEDSVSFAQYSPDGTKVVTASKDKTARLWDISPVISDNKGLLLALAEAVSGEQLSELGAVEPLEDQIGQLNKLREQTANAPSGEPTAESFIRWFFSDPWTRTISPHSRLTVPEYIRQQIDAGRRDQVEQEFSGHPLFASDSM